jgi:hypothetical protein
MPGPYDGWLPDSVKRCSLYLAHICEKFRNVAQNLRIIDYYQVPSPDGAYFVVCTRPLSLPSLVFEVFPMLGVTLNIRSPEPFLTVHSAKMKTI